MHWNGSWALFSTDKQPVVGSFNGDFAPVSHSGNRLTLEAHDKSLLSTLRKWATSFFATNDVPPKNMYKPLKLAKSEKSDFDVIVKIVNVHEMDGYTNELKLRDQSG